MNGSGTLTDIWKELEKITLSEVNATQKDRGGMFSFSWISQLQIFRCEYTLWSKYKNQEGTIAGAGNGGAIKVGRSVYKWSDEYNGKSEEGL